MLKSASDRSIFESSSISSNTLGQAGVNWGGFARKGSSDFSGDIFQESRWYAGFEAGVFPCGQAETEA